MVYWLLNMRNWKIKWSHYGPSFYSGKHHESDRSYSCFLTGALVKYGLRTEILTETIWHCCNLEKCSTSFEEIRTGKRQWVITARLRLITFMVSKTIPMSKFSRHLDTSPTRWSVNYLLCMAVHGLLIIYVPSVQSLTDGGLSKSAICSSGFWHTCDLETRSRSSTWTMWTLSKVIIMQSLEDLALMVSKKKPAGKEFLVCFFFFN